jgi:hypothetical protein
LSWRYRANPHGWAGVIPKGGIAVTIYVHREKTRKPALRLVLPRHPFTGLKGVPNTLEYRMRGRVHGVDAEVWVDIHQRHPTRTELSRAQRVISAIRFR